ncbi:hypothetical protein [Thermoflexus sp.]|jgi:hypothetical protein|uniref:hypothetical protein n=1 Tax=Thermoflexus sp. TaxID=1969742 RepID=UPI00263048DA|nr:hypothetical protein [Thermoflexus sp.]
MEIRVSPKSLLLVLVLALVAVGALFAARALAARPAREDPDVEVAKRAVVQVYSAARGEAYDALSPDLAERFKREAERMPDWQRGSRVEIYGAALVWRGEGFSEVAVAGIAKPNKPDAATLPIRVFVRVQNGKAVAFFTSLP